MAELHHNQPAEEICTDPYAAEAKKGMLQRMRWSSVLGSIGTVCTFIGGPLVAAGMVGLFKSIGSTAAAEGGSVLFSVAGLGIGAVTAGMLSAGALFASIAVVANYASTRIAQGHYIDQFEMNAKSTAKHLVEEIKKESMCLTTTPESPARTDNRNWVERIESSRDAAVAQQHIH